MRIVMATVLVLLAAGFVASQAGLPTKGVRSIRHLGLR